MTINLGAVWPWLKLVLTLLMFVYIGAILAAVLGFDPLKVLRWEPQGHGVFLAAIAFAYSKLPG